MKELTDKHGGDFEKITTFFHAFLSDSRKMYINSILVLTSIFLFSFSCFQVDLFSQDFFLRVFPGVHAFFISNTSPETMRKLCLSTLKLAKTQAKAKQHPEAELLLFENYSLSLYTLSSKK